MSQETGQDVISLLMPTRGRRLLAEKFITAAYSRASSPEQLEIVVYSDEDDPDSHSLGSLDVKVVLLIGPRVTMGQMYTSCFERATGDIVVMVNDDVDILTNGWDTFVRKIHARHPDGIYLAYPDDLYKRKPTFPIISRKCAEILQDPYPTEYLGAFIDTHLVDIFRRIEQKGFNRIHFLDNVQFEHRHYRAGKSAPDPTYLIRPRFNGDRTFASLIDKRVDQAKALISEIKNEPMSLRERYSRRCPKAIGPKILFVIRNVALDSSLPGRWRSYITAFLIVRAIVGPFYKCSPAEE